MDKEFKACDFCLLKRPIIVAKSFEVNSNDVLLEIEHFLHNLENT